MPAKRPRPRKAKTLERADLALLPSPRAPALVTRAAFGAALALLGCRGAERSPPPMPAPPMNGTGPTPVMTAVTEEDAEAAFRAEAGAPVAAADAATPTDAGPSAAASATAAKVTATAVATPPMVRPPMVRPPMVRPPPPMVAPPPHPVPPNKLDDSR